VLFLPGYVAAMPPVFFAGLSREADPIAEASAFLDRGDFLKRTTCAKGQ
jgi:hypothetical protein